jgi:hypothetical protein
MKKRLLFTAALTIALVLPSFRNADAVARREQCFEENYGSQCGTTCVYYNDQGSVVDWCTTLHAC